MNEKTSRSDEREVGHLFRELRQKIILQTHLVDLVELGFQPVEMFLFVVQIVIDQFARAVVAKFEDTGECHRCRL